MLLRTDKQMGSMQLLESRGKISSLKGNVDAVSLLILSVYTSTFLHIS